MPIRPHNARHVTPPITRGTEPNPIPTPNIVPPAIRKRRETPVIKYFIVTRGSSSSLLHFFEKIEEGLELFFLRRPVILLTKWSFVLRLLLLPQMSFKSWERFNGFLSMTSFVSIGKMRQRKRSSSSMASNPFTPTDPSSSASRPFVRTLRSPFSAAPCTRRTEHWDFL